MEQKADQLYTQDIRCAIKSDQTEGGELRRKSLMTESGRDWHNAETRGMDWGDLYSAVDL